MRPYETLPAPAIGLHVRLALVALMAVIATDVYQTVRAEPPEANGAARAPQLAWPDKAYRVEWEEAYVPQEAAANLMLAVPVTLRNSGNKAWPASAVFIAYHWFRDYKLVVWDGERTRLPRDVRAGGRATLAVRVKAPADPGDYLLQLTLVHEYVTWFEQKGANTVLRPVVVRSKTEDATQNDAAARTGVWSALRALCGPSGSAPCKVTN